jgi:hypothetical protein
MDQVLEAALRRRPQALKAPAPEVVEPTEALDERPSAPDKVRRGFPPAEQPPAVVAPREAA